MSSAANSATEASPELLQIRVSCGSGTGPTRMAAFDAALSEAGLHNFNLVRLSSVIPPGAEVITVDGPAQLRGGHGDLLYCVYADAYASTPGEQAWAGIAWSLNTDGSGAGLFVEHSGSSEELVRRDLTMSLESMANDRPEDYVLSGSALSSARCEDHAVAAVAVAAYRVVGWNTDPTTPMGGGR